MPKITIDMIRQAFIDRGAILISREYVNAKTPLYFNCTKCGKKHHITWSDFKSGYNKNLVCPDCQPNKKPTIERIRKEFAAKGAELITTEYKNNHQDLYFKCSNCGAPHKITWLNYTNGRNKDLVCSDCNKKSIYTIEKVRKLFEERGLTLLTEEYKKTTQPLEYLCPNCGKKYHTTLADILASGQKDFLCKDCREAQKVTLDEIRKAFEKKGAKLESEVYLNSHSPLYFRCFSCGALHKTTWSRFQSGINTDLLCKKCYGRDFYTIDKVRKLFESKGAKLLTQEYLNNYQRLDFLCSRCGEPHYTTLRKFNAGLNKDLLCAKCSKGNMFNPSGQKGHRNNIDKQWYKYVLKFYNIPVGERDRYAIHHILPYGAFDAYRLSILNGFPLKKEIHSRSYINPQGIRDPYHMLKDSLNPENWPEEAKLPHQVYDNFRFLNLNEKLITTVIYGEEAILPNTLYSKKEEYNFEGKFFIPIYFEELFDKNKSQILYSMLKIRLYRYYPDIYSYTNTQFSRYYARNLYIEEVSSEEAKVFLTTNHIQGFVSAQYNISLKKDGEILSIMSFGIPRSAKNIQFELLRFCFKKNIQVVGGAQRLFKYFVKTYTPSSILTYCDIRFSSIDPQETVYPKLGFEYSHYSKPNYKYYHPDYNRLFSRWQFQKHKLKEKLDIFDPDLSENENMKNNGYIRQYDCGNHVFIWRALK